MSKELHGSEARLRWLKHVVHIGGRLMSWTPDSSSRNTTFIFKLHHINGVPSATLDWRNIKTKEVLCLMSTTNMEVRVAVRLVAFHGGQSAFFADLAGRFESLSGNEPDALSFVQ